MKKIKLWMMLFCIGLLFVSGGVAEEMALDLTQMTRFETASSLCWLDDSLYVLGNKGVYSWKSGSEKMNTVIDLAVASNYDYVQDCPEDESEATVWNQMLQLIFTDGEALYGLHPYSGMIKKIEGNGKNERNTTIIHEDGKIMIREYVQKRLMERIDKPKRPNTK